MDNSALKEAKGLLDAGNLTAAIEAATREVKAHPADVAARTFLFELLLFAGEWERALKQLDVVEADAGSVGRTSGSQHIEAMRARELSG